MTMEILTDKFDSVFYLMGEGGSKYHYKRAIIGPPAKRVWRFAGVPMMAKH